MGTGGMSKTTAEFGMCNIFAAAYKPKMGIHVENDGPILRAHDLPRQELLSSCVHNKY
jgi:hypothetical protein